MKTIIGEYGHTLIAVLVFVLLFFCMRHTVVAGDSGIKKVADTCLDRGRQILQQAELTQGFDKYWREK